jgi:hypothetical protein
VKHNRLLTEVVIVLVFFIDSLGPVLSISVNAKYGVLAAIIVVVHSLVPIRSELNK